MSGVLFVTYLALASGAFAASYYVDSAAGSDSNAGTSTGAAWQTLSKVNAKTFVSGDRLLFKRGGSWTGQLNLKGSGASGNPIVVDAYGAGNLPLINGGGVGGGTVSLSDVQYWEIQNLEITNPASADSTGRLGVKVNGNTLAVINHIYLRNLVIHDVRGNNTFDNGKGSGGILFGNTASGTFTNYNDILVEGCVIHDLYRVGITVNASNASTSAGGTNVRVRFNTIYNTGGDGVIVRYATSPLIEFNQLHDWGGTIYGGGTDPSYAAGLWARGCTGAIFQCNEVYNGIATADGEAFDADIDCNGAIFQFNYTHNNKGGVMLIWYQGSNTTYRYNVSYNDGDGIIVYSSGVAPNTQVYNNTIYIPAGSTTKILKNFNAGSTSTNTTTFRNNIVYLLGSGGYDQIGAAGKVTASNNCFYGNHPASELADANKITADPGLAGTPSGAMTGRAAADVFKLQGASPCIGAGVAIAGNGGRDFWANAVPNGAMDIGAHEFPSIATANQAPAVATVATGAMNSGGATASLAVLGADDQGETNLAYTWQTTGTPPAALSFFPNGTNLARSTTATFTKLGTYNFLVTIRDAGNLVATSAVSVTVTATTGSIVVSPASVTAVIGRPQQFSAQGLDQFGVPLASQPTFGWSVSGGGTINSAGLFTPGSTAGGPFTVTATGAGLTNGTAQVTVAANQAPTITITSPANGATNLQAPVSLAATASDADGAISKVEFYNGATLLNTDATSPYAYDWSTSPGAYSVTAKAYDDLNKVSTSSAVSFTVLPTPLPGAPTNLTATAISGAQVNLAWTDNASNETSFKVEQATDAAFTQNVVVTSAAANATGASVTGLNAVTTYFFRVRASNGAGDSANTNVATATTLSLATEPFIGAAGGALNASAGGHGWSAAWATNTAIYTFGSGSLSYADAQGATVVTSGNRLVFGPGTASYQQATRTTTFFAEKMAGGQALDVWFSCLIAPQSGSRDFNPWGNNPFSNGPAATGGAALTYSSASSWSGSSQTSASAPSVTLAANQTNLVICRYQVPADKHSFTWTWYVNPTDLANPSTTATTIVWTASSTAGAVRGLDGFGIRSRTDANTAFELDELRYGDTVAQVVPFTEATVAPGAASSPSPANAASGVSVTPTLSWAPGTGATSHVVRFGTSNPPAVIGSQSAAGYQSGSLTANTTHYWRVDEVNAAGTTPSAVWSFRTAPLTDSVGDGIPDAWRAHFFGGDGTTAAGLAADSADRDGDGRTNLQEYIEGTDPTDPASSLNLVITSSGAQVTLTFSTILPDAYAPGTTRVYTVESSADLVNPNWQSLGQWPATGSPVTTSQAISPSRTFYRLKAALLND